MMSNENVFLCLFCRNVGHSTADCPNAEAQISSRDALREAHFLHSLQKQSSSLCVRCSQYPIGRLSKGTGVLDILQSKEPARKGYKWIMRQWNEWWQAEKQKRMELGPLAKILLSASCPLCRLLFYNFPRESPDFSNQTVNYQLEPMLSYDLLLESETEQPLNIKAKYAIHFAVKAEGESAVSALTHGFYHGHVTQTFAPGRNSSLGRDALCARRVPEVVDFTLLKSWLERCQKLHGTDCYDEWSDQLLSSRMIDVDTRRVVQCPTGCEYVALSYVWGGIQPAPGALEKHTLPQTIEDAITVTKSVGKQYLWVDALCIDQQPTAQQTQQLKMMEVIYRCAYVTIIAISGENSGNGFPGISEQGPRPAPIVESIRGVEYLTTGPRLRTIWSDLTYNSRAWTLQEVLFSKRRLCFENHQVHFVCGRTELCESIDDTYDPANYLENYEPWFQISESPVSLPIPGSSNERLRQAGDAFEQFLSAFTVRKMSYDHDSLNAGLGMLSHICKMWSLQPFEWGMPVRDLLQSLRWYHRSTVIPRRRPGFPSWSWTGWEGEAIYSGSLDLTQTGRIVDMKARFLHIDNQVLTIEATLVRLEIRTCPFTDAYIPGSTRLVGIIKERNTDVGDTLPAGIFDFLVIERSRLWHSRSKSWVDHVYMLMLEWDGDTAMRKTKVRLYVEEGMDLDQTGASQVAVKLK